MLHEVNSNDENPNGTYNFERPVLIIDADHVPLHGRQSGGDYQQAETAAETQGPDSGSRGAGVVEVEALSPLVHEEKHLKDQTMTANTDRGVIYPLTNQLFCSGEVRGFG